MFVPTATSASTKYRLCEKLREEMQRVAITMKCAKGVGSFGEDACKDMA